MAIDILLKSDDTVVDAKFGSAKVSDISKYISRAPAKRLMGGMLSPFYHNNHFPGFAASVRHLFEHKYK